MAILLSNYTTVQLTSMTCKEGLFILLVTNSNHSGLKEYNHINVGCRMNRWDNGHILWVIKQFGEGISFQGTERVRNLNWKMKRQSMYCWVDVEIGDLMKKERWGFEEYSRKHFKSSSRWKRTNFYLDEQIWRLKLVKNISSNFLIFMHMQPTQSFIIANFMVRLPRPSVWIWIVSTTFWASNLHTKLEN